MIDFMNTEYYIIYIYIYIDIINVVFIVMITGTQVSAVTSTLSLLKPSQVNQSPVRFISTQLHCDNPWSKGYEAELHVHLHQHNLCNVDGNW